MTRLHATDYVAQFTSLTEDEWNEIGMKFLMCRLFEVRVPSRSRRATNRRAQARKAFMHAKELEDQGIGVAFGEFAGDYYVWSE
jgi:hypothetical protein